MDYIQLKNITFSYENNIFTDFSLSIPAKNGQHCLHRPALEKPPYYS